MLNTRCAGSGSVVVIPRGSKEFLWLPARRCCFPCLASFPTLPMYQVSPKKGNHSVLLLPDDHATWKKNATGVAQSLCPEGLSVRTPYHSYLLVLY